MIELKALTEAIPSIAEFPSEVTSNIVSNLRDVHQQVLRKDVPAEETKFIEDLVGALRKCDLSEVERVLISEIKRLHDRINQTRIPQK